jgi:hypothetical protein
MIRCDDKKCRHNDNFICGLRQCKSYEAWEREDYAELMKEQNPNCHREGAKYKSNTVGGTVK